MKSIECELNGSDEMLIKSIDDWEAKALASNHITLASLAQMLLGEPDVAAF